MKNSAMADAFRDRLIKCLEDKRFDGMPLGEVSVELGLGENTLHEWFRNGRYPHLNTLANVAERLGVTLSWLVGGPK